MKACSICQTTFVPTNESAETRQCCQECIETFQTTDAPKRMNKTRHFKLPDGRTFQIVFGHEGVVYDLIGKDGEVEVEYGYDFLDDLTTNEENQDQ